MITVFITRAFALMKRSYVMYPVSFHLNIKPHVMFPQLEILTSLATETNISTILREFQVCLVRLSSIFSIVKKYCNCFHEFLYFVMLLK